MRLTAVVLASLLALAACTGEDSGPTASGPAPAGSPRAIPSAASASAKPAFQVVGGRVRGPSSIWADLGSEVVFTVSSDKADEVHVHGYDKSVDVGAGRTVTVRLTADLPGAFEVELERQGLSVTQLRVAP